MASTEHYNAVEGGADESALPNFTVDQLRHHFEDARDRLLAEYRMRQQVFPQDHPQRYQKLQDIRIILNHLSWMKDQLKPIAIVPPEQLALIEADEETPAQPYQYV